MGLVNKIFPVDQLREKTMEYVRDLVNNASPRELSASSSANFTRFHFRRLRKQPSTRNREMALAARSRDFKEKGVASFIEKRIPNFTGD